VGRRIIVIRSGKKGRRCRGEGGGGEENSHDEKGRRWRGGEGKEEEKREFIMGSGEEGRKRR
jgi:hypothetical protein